MWLPSHEHVAAAALAGATIGTALGQGAWGLWDACFDPVCGLSWNSVIAGGVPLPFTPITLLEVRTLLHTAITTGSSLNLGPADFAAAGATGAAAEAFIEQGMALFVNGARVAAAANAGDRKSVV